LTRRLDHSRKPRKEEVKEADRKAESSGQRTAFSKPVTRQMRGWLTKNAAAKKKTMEKKDKIAGETVVCIRVTLGEDLNSARGKLPALKGRKG